MLRAFAAAGAETGKPVMVASVNPESLGRSIRRMALEMGVVPLQGLHDAGKVMARWAAYSQMARDDAARGLPNAPFAVPSQGGPVAMLSEARSKQALAAYGLPVPAGRIVALKQIRARSLPTEGSVVLKVLDDRVPHKTEVGGVALGLRNTDEIYAAAEQMVAAVRSKAGIDIDTFLLEPMQPPPLAELIVGVKRDPLFGMVLVIGAGGVLVELLGDARQLLLPVDRGDIESELRQLRSFALLDGFRGKPRADIPAVVDAIAAVAAYASDHRHDLAELDVNPLMIYPDRVVAVDALIAKFSP